MKKISTIKQWHKENCQYNGFFEFECFSCLTLFLFVGNICIHNTKAVDWLIWVIWLQNTLFQAYKWLHNRETKRILDFAKDRMGEMFNELIDDKYKERERLISANRRRKRTEKKLKRAKKMYRYALCRHLELIYSQNHQPEVVLTKEQLQAYGEVSIRGIAEAVERHALTGAVVPADKFMDGMLRYKKTRR